MMMRDESKPMRRYVLPGIFWRDHYDRCGFGVDAGEGAVIKENSRTVVVELDCAAISDLRSDANHYGNGGLDFAGEKAAYRSLISSARATVKAIARQWVNSVVETKTPTRKEA